MSEDKDATIHSLLAELQTERVARRYAHDRNLRLGREVARLQATIKELRTEERSMPLRDPKLPVYAQGARH